jgi:hypothetical protein
MLERFALPPHGCVNRRRGQFVELADEIVRVLGLDAVSGKDGSGEILEVGVCLELPKNPTILGGGGYSR